MKQLVLILFIVFAYFQADAQGYFWQSGGKPKRYKYLTVDGGIGLRMFSGDIQQRGSLFNPMKLAYGVAVRYQMSPHFAPELQLAGRGYRGKAEFGGYPDAVAEMNGTLWEGDLVFQYSILRWEDFTKRMFTDRDPVRKGNVFIGAGAGAALFNSSFSQRTYNTQNFVDSLGNDTSFALPVDLSGGGSGFAFRVPVVFGARYRFTPSVSLGFQLQYHLYFSDNLDGVERKNNDGMTLFMVKLGYSFGQDKTAARMGRTPRQQRKGK